jgi:hypothetical protein
LITSSIGACENVDSVKGTPVAADAPGGGYITLKIRRAQADQADRAHEDRRLKTLGEKVDRQVTLGRADHHPGNDSVVEICVNVGLLGSPIPGGRRHIPIHPVRKRLGRLPLDRSKVKGVA